MNIDLVSFAVFCSYLGKDFAKYIGNLEPHVLENSFQKKDHDLYDTDAKHFVFNQKKELEYYYLRDIEKENLIKIANNKDYKSVSLISRSSLSLINDHFKMIHVIREYDPDVYMKARTTDEFHDEHRELTKMNSAIQKGWVIEYKFNEKMVEDVEKPLPLKINLGLEDSPVFGESIKNDDVTFYPYILKREEDYIEEGQFMHHCVATYADKEKSIIISVRTKDASDRVTCEYNCQDGRLIQSRHFCNGLPPADIEYVINDLNKKIQKYARLGMLHSTEKIKVPLRINGVEIKQPDPVRVGDIYNMRNLFPEF
jgi:hypothetical protein